MRFARPVQWTLALAFVSSLGFGATQALAAPREGAALRACDWATCYNACRAKGYFTGKCYNDVCTCTPRP
ncbi:MAG TPA: hypothetical protein VF615_20940 [Longimicrobiaceae bacterium]|jgi:hypothetical protein